MASGTLELAAGDILVETSSAEGYACAEDAGFLAELDTNLTEDLVNEGLAREVVRSIQDARKQAGLEVSDRIVLGVSGSPGIENALAVHRDFIMTETLAIEWEAGQDSPLFRESRELGDEKWLIEFRKA
jgi:isoleucyl-tRNA synthetase